MDTSHGSNCSLTNTPPLPGGVDGWKRFYLWALRENLSSPSTAARSSLEKKHLCKASGTCARLSAPLSPAHQLTAGKDAARILHPDGFLLLAGKKGRRKGQDVLHVAQRGLSKVHGIGLGSGLDVRQPKKAAGWARQRCAPTSPRGPAGCSSGNPPRAPRPTHRSRSPAPPSPGTGTAAAAACPRGRALAAAEDAAGGRAGGGAPPLQWPLRPAGNPKFGRARGGAQGAEGPRPAQLRLSRSARPDCSHGRAPPTGEARIGARGSSADALLPGTGPQECDRPPGDGTHWRTPSTHRPYRAIAWSPVLKHCPPVPLLILRGEIPLKWLQESTDHVGGSWPLALKLESQSPLREQAVPEAKGVYRHLIRGLFLGTCLLQQGTKNI